MVVGLTVVAFGTSAPELTASLIATITGSGDICFGNVVGSNVANIALILGVTAMVLPVHVNKSLIRWEIPFMVGISVITLGIGFMHRVDRSAGLVLIALFVWYMIHCIKSPPANIEVHGEEARKPYWFLTTLVFVGMGGLVIGGWLFVNGAQNIARLLGVSDAIIGLTVVALGTSLPELATSVVAALKGHADISIGNVIGSNVFNILFVLGTTATLLPFSISPDRFMFYIGLPFMMGLAIMIWPLSARGSDINRIEGGVFFSIYCIYLALAVIMG
ncbi:calcium/sodium antiporter [Candidatus Latescibacterota bacterium]